MPTLFDPWLRSDDQLSSRGPTLYDGVLGFDPFSPAIPPVLFPPQMFGLRGRTASGTVDLCLVNIGDAGVGFGGVLEIWKAGLLLAIYLVDPNDPFASPFRIQTTTGTKAVRLKT